MPEILLEIEKLVYGGDGLARDQGRVVLTPFVLPGERIEADVRREKNDLLRGRATAIVLPSPERVAPGCEYFLRCGGCQYQHIRYEFQLEQKRAILLEVLRRIGHIENPPEPAIVADEPWQYRNRTQLHIDANRIGYFETGSHDLVAIDHCPISSPKLNESIAALAREIGGLPRFGATLELFTNETELQFNLQDRAPRQFVDFLRMFATTEPIVYDGFRVSRNTFFQANRFLTGRLVDAAIGSASGRHAMELYAGAGLLTLPLARRFERVTAVEAAASAFRDLEYNARAAGVTNLATHNETAEAHLLTVFEPPDLIVADPPRAGLGKLCTAELVRIRSPRLTIVSCDAPTLARDLRPLLAAGYRIQALTLVDLFPQTAHFETIAQLEL